MVVVGVETDVDEGKRRHEPKPARANESLFRNFLGDDVLVAPGCNRVPTAHKPDEKWIDAALSKAPTVRQYHKNVGRNFAWLHDGEERDSVVVAIGEDFPDHFTRGLTAKVQRDGTVLILDEIDGEDHWRLDWKGNDNGQ